MPDKHEVGGSSPLGPTIKVKERTEAESRRERPRAFVERAEHFDSVAESEMQGTKSS